MLSGTCGPAQIEVGEQPDGKDAADQIKLRSAAYIGDVWRR